jgi:hypothetical protein
MNKITIYGQQCAMAGLQCWDVEITEDGRAIHPDTGNESDDVVVFDLSESEASACELLADLASGGTSSYWARVAATIRDNIDE